MLRYTTKARWILLIKQGSWCRNRICRFRARNSSYRGCSNRIKSRKAFNKYKRNPACWNNNSLLNKKFKSFNNSNKCQRIYSQHKKNLCFRIKSYNKSYSDNEIKWHRFNKKHTNTYIRTSKNKRMPRIQKAGRKS